MYAVAPTVMFDDDYYVDFMLSAENLIQTESLRCKILDAVLPARFYEDPETGVEAVLCTVTFAEFIHFQDAEDFDLLNLPEQLYAEASNDG